MINKSLLMTNEIQTWQLLKPAERQVDVEKKCCSEELLRAWQMLTKTNTTSFQKLIKQFFSFAVNTNSFYPHFTVDSQQYLGGLERAFTDVYLRHNCSRNQASEQNETFKTSYFRFIYSLVLNAGSGSARPSGADITQTILFCLLHLLWLQTSH